MTKDMGTLIWMAPEVINSAKYGHAADVYGFGMVALYVIAGIKEPSHYTRLPQVAHQSMFH